MCINHLIKHNLHGYLYFNFYLLIKLIKCFYFYDRDLKTYARGLMKKGSQQTFSSQGSGDKRHPHTIVLLDEKAEGRLLPIY